MFKVGSIFIPVTSLEESTKWYEEHLGVKKIAEWGEGMERGVGFCFPKSDVQLGLVEVQHSQSTEFTIQANKKNVYFNFIVENIEESYKQLQKKGIQVTELKDSGCMKSFEFFDLDGNAFSVVSEEESSPFHEVQVRKLQQK
ncbi:VOC family protein [Metabacillus iocasae]|uniref:Lactoylglutathione lyase n=1 Tax=Priestia iocasae TaxID=2291674 RepID=A0ABS2QRT2_9BACI|nr:VOC family protein [Metabacillus iocasae]MBM7702149.1 putative lactoylglutathione lyase [Metabacillus iocasae]